MSEQPRRHVPVPEKVAALKRHLLEGTPVSAICDELGIKPTVFYSWQKLLFEGGVWGIDKDADQLVARKLALMPPQATDDLRLTRNCTETLFKFDERRREEFVRNRRAIVKLPRQEDFEPSK